MHTSKVGTNRLWSHSAILVMCFVYDQQHFIDEQHAKMCYIGDVVP